MREKVELQNKEITNLKEKEKEINELKDKVEKQNKEINNLKDNLDELKNKSVIMKDDERNMIFSEIEN